MKKISGAKDEVCYMLRGLHRRCLTEVDMPHHDKSNIYLMNKTLNMSGILMSDSVYLCVCL